MSSSQTTRKTQHSRLRANTFLRPGLKITLPANKKHTAKVRANAMNHVPVKNLRIRIPSIVVHSGDTPQAPKASPIHKKPPRHPGPSVYSKTLKAKRAASK